MVVAVVYEKVALLVNQLREDVIYRFNAVGSFFGNRGRVHCSGGIL